MLLIVEQQSAITAVYLAAIEAALVSNPGQCHGGSTSQQHSGEAVDDLESGTSEERPAGASSSERVKHAWRGSIALKSPKSTSQRRSTGHTIASGRLGTLCIRLLTSCSQELFPLPPPLLLPFPCNTPPHPQPLPARGSCHVDS
jgi:hypothetical protein